MCTYACVVEYLSSECRRARATKVACTREILSKTAMLSSMADSVALNTDESHCYFLSRQGMKK